MSLTKFYADSKLSTDKYDLGYFDLFYEEIFLGLRSKPVNVLEIGVLHGGSVLLWSEYLHANSKIVGADLHKDRWEEGLRTFKERGAALSRLSNIEYVDCDAYTAKNLGRFKDNNFDLIIDDGPHTFESFTFLIENYRPKLKDGGVMVVEDIINVSWTPLLADLAKKTGYSGVTRVNAAGKQKNKGLLDMWSGGLDVLILKK